MLSYKKKTINDQKIYLSILIYMAVESRSSFRIFVREGDSGFNLARKKRRIQPSPEKTLICPSLNRFQSKI